jgi:hypothetical protein
MISNSMRIAASGLAISVFATGALAQWSTTSDTDLKLSDYSGDQVQPKIAPTADGGAWVSWLDNGHTSYRNDTFTWDGSTGMNRAAMTGPAGRLYHGMAYDSTRHVTVAYGGEDSTGQILGDTWEWNGSAWTQSVASGPSARERVAIAFDAAHSKIVLFGGVDGSSSLRGETWVYNGTWTQLNPAHSPSARKDAAMAYDPVRQVVVLFAGDDNSPSKLADTWEWNGTDWTAENAIATPPGNRSAHAMAYDYNTSKVLLYGGSDFTGTPLNDTWLYDGTNWTNVVPATSPQGFGRINVAMSNDFNAAGPRVSFFGGYGQLDNLDQPTNLSQMWEWDGTTWTQKSGFTSPTARTGMGAAYDSTNHVTVLFGTGPEAGGYDVYVQRVNAGGIEQLPHNGVLVGDRSVSSTTDYGLITDSAGNVVTAYNDNLVLGPMTGGERPSVCKVSSSGTMLWKWTSPTAIGNGSSARVCQVSDGGYVVAYTNFNTVTVVLQKLDANGVPQWSTTANPSGFALLADLKASGSGAVVSWVQFATTSFLGNKGLAAQKYDVNGNALWNSGNPVPVLLATSAGGSPTLPNGYQPTFLSDGAGGAVFGWYELAGNAYIQHVLADGSFKFPSKIANTGPTAPVSRARLSAGLAYDPANGGTYYLASSEGDNGATPYTVFVQKFQSDGTRLWGDTGALVNTDVRGFEPGIVQAQALPGGSCEVVFDDTRNTLGSMGVVDSAMVTSEGVVGWHNLFNSDATTAKDKLATARSTQGFTMVAYNWGGGPFSSGTADIGMGRLNNDGTKGAPACYANCDGSTTAPVLNVADFTCFLQKYAAGCP